MTPLTLFAVLSFVDMKTALAPLIPSAIMGELNNCQKQLGKNRGRYTAFGDTFLENLQGLTTLKIYQSDEKAVEKWIYKAAKIIFVRAV